MDSTTVIHSIVLGLAQGGVYALIASGLTLIYAVTRHFNFAHGGLLVLTLYLSYFFYDSFGIDPYLSFLIISPIMFIIGLLVFRFLFQPLLSSGPLTSILMFYGIALIIEYLMPITFDSLNHIVPTFLDLSKIHIGSISIKTALLVALIVSLIVSFGFYWLLKTTDFGRSIRAVAQRPESAALMGINVRRTQMAVFALAFVLLAVAGAAYIPMTGINASMGLHITLFAFIVIALGGMGHFIGALVAGIIIGLAESLSSLFWGTSLSATIPYAIFIMVLLFRPQGLFGSKER